MPRYNEPPLHSEMEVVSDEECEAYEMWDTKRRTRFPNAQHDHWDSFEGNEPVAGWNPHTGKCW